jgi:hypothetical protein
MLKAGFWFRLSGVTTLGLLIVAGVMGCASKQERAMEQARKQAVATGEPQQVSSVDKNGITTTSVVEPPAAGQKEPTVVTTTAPPAPGAPKPAPKEPTVSVLRDDGPDLALDQTGPGQSGQAPSAQAQSGQALSSGPAQSAPAHSGQAQAGQPQSGQAKPSPAGSPAGPPEVRIPAGTSLAIRVDQAISVKSNRPGDKFTGEVVEPIAASDGSVLVPKGARVKGRVDAAHKRGHFKGESVLVLRLAAIELNGTEYPVETRNMEERKKGKGKRSAAMIGGGSGLGMLVGGLAAGPAGLLWGGLAGGGAGTAAAGLTGNKDLKIPAETVVHFNLAQDLVVRQGK